MGVLAGVILGIADAVGQGLVTKYQTDKLADAYAEAHLKGAVNIPYGTVAASLELIPDDVPVYVNCYSGQTSSQTTALLRIAGKYAYNISGGYGNISGTEGYEKYADTEVHTLTDASYEVADEIEAAIADYYTAATSGTFASFHFPVDSLKELVEAQSDAYTILDVRAAEDFAAGHIAGAMNIPFGKGMQDSFAQIPTDKPVVINCMIPEDDKVFPMVPAGAPISEAFDADDLKDKEA